ncbi:MAG: hypothetical protein RI988_373 [Pseudomonadota bacterium]|jgi:predicted peroxiredoxin
MPGFLIHVTCGPDDPTRAALAFLVAKGVRFHLSGMSAKARGMGEQDLAGKPAEFGMPNVLVRLAAQADRVITY